MIPVPETILTSITDAFGIRKDALSYLGGGRVGSDGIAYSFVRNGKDLVLKIMAFPEKNETKNLKEIEERLQFVNFIGENGVDIVYPLVNNNQRLMESLSMLASMYCGMNRSDFNPLKVIFDSFLNGYEAENHIDSIWLENLDQFMNYCRMLIFTVVQDELEKKPDEKERLRMILKNPVIVRKLFS